MQSFTTQSHQRNYQGSVVLENPNRVAYTRQTGKRRSLLAGIATSVLALAVAVTGGWLSATALHNQQSKHQVQALETQTAEVVTTDQTSGIEDQIVILDKNADGTGCNTTHHAIMTLEARPEDDTDRDAAATQEERPQHSAEHHHRRGKRLRRVPISDQHHDAESMPKIESNRSIHSGNTN